MCTEVQSAPETPEVGCSVKLKEGTKVMIQLCSKEGTETSRPPDQQTAGPADYQSSRQRWDQVWFGKSKVGLKSLTL